MSGQASIQAVSTAQAGDAVANNYNMDVVGSRYELAPATVADGEIRGFQIDSQGRQIIIGPTADANAFIYRPIGVSGVYRAALPTYADGQVAVVHMDVNGRTFVLDDQSLAVLNLINAKLNSLGQKLMAGSMPVAIASDQSAIPASQSGAWTTGRTWTLDSGTDSVSSVQSGVWTTARSWTLASGTDSVAAVQSGVWTTARSWTLSAAGDSVTAAQGAPAAIANAWPVKITDGTNTVAPTALGSLLVSGLSAVGTAPSLNPVSVSGVDGGGLKRAFLTDTAGRMQANTAGKSRSNAPVRNVYSTTNVTTAAYVQLVAATTALTSEVEIFDSSGQTMVLAVGAAGSEVDQFNIFPGGNGRVPLSIPAGSRVAVKAVSANATVGELDINFYG